MTTLFRPLALIGACLMSFATPQASAIEQPRYEVLKEAMGVELRAYAPQIVAEVSVEAGAITEASSRGFRPLAGYIFGDNQGAGQIAMTAPVTTQPVTGAKIAMTAPVTTAPQGDNTYVVRFSMPSDWTMETLPLPNNPAVKLVELDSQTRAAYRFVGERSQARIDEATAKIVAFLETEGLTAAAPPIIAGYDGPRVPVERKRWEVMVVVAQ